MDESLFTTRQLTEYRKWPDGRKGCLFYIGEGSGSICIIDTPLRRLDKFRLFKKLCNQEVMSLYNNESVVSGFGALLFKLMITTNPISLDYEELWKQYEEHFHKGSIPSRFMPLFYLLDEAHNITSWNKDIILDTCKDKIVLYNLYMCCHQILMRIIKDWSNQIPTLIWKIHPVFAHPNAPLYFQISEENKSIIVTYQLQTMSYTKEIESCFFDYILNFFAAKQACEQFLTNSNLYQSEEDLLCRFGRKKPLFKVSDIHFDLSGIDVQQIFDSYIDFAQKPILDNLKCDVNFASLTDAQKEEKVMTLLYQKTLEQFNTQSYLQKYASQEQEKIYDDIANGFFKYIHNTINIDITQSIKKPNNIITVSLQKTPEPHDDLPSSGDYVALAKWLKKQKEIGNDYYEDAGRNRSQMCRELKKILGWFPKENSLRKRL